MSDEFSIKARNYKCFGNDAQGFEEIKPFNIIIGRNNSGKSTLLELIKHAVAASEGFFDLGHGNSDPAIQYSGYIKSEHITGVFPHTVSGGDLDGNHHEYGQQYIGAKLTWEQQQENRKIILIDRQLDIDSNPQITRYMQGVSEAISNPLSGKEFCHLNADRDISQEGESTGDMELGPDGHNLTNLFRELINEADLPGELIQQEFFEALNTVMRPDADFTGIVVQRHRSPNLWEIFLEEPTKGKIPLTHTGSGLKTIILTLACILVVPRIKNKDLSNFIFLFEELENNIHPSLLRRLLGYLRAISETERCPFFITTHSSVVIDMFSSDDAAQIIHVTHDGDVAHARTVKTYVENKGVLDDLDIRASDLLQANGIVWVEGPSDRLYFNRWVQVVSNGLIREGSHYQCVIYGGRLLAHFSAEDPDLDESALINFLRINRNAIVLMDSDLRGPDGEINETKQRIVSEIENVGGLVWITEGKEVENYIPMDALRSIYERDNLRTLAKNQDIASYLDSIRSGLGKHYSANKVLFAERACAHIERSGMDDTHDLTEMVSKAVTKILRWNALDSIEQLKPEQLTQGD